MGEIGDSSPSTAAKQMDNGEKTLNSGLYTSFVQMLSVKIIDYYVVSSCCKSYTLYTIKYNDFGRIMVVTRRFSDFIELDSKLRELGESTFLKLPEKKYFGNTEPFFIVKRQQELRAYINLILQKGSPEQLLCFFKFLGFSDESLLYLQLASAKSNLDRKNYIRTLSEYLVIPLDTRHMYVNTLTKCSVELFDNLSKPVEDIPFSNHYDGLSPGGSQDMPSPNNCNVFSSQNIKYYSSNNTRLTGNFDKIDVISGINSNLLSQVGRDPNMYIDLRLSNGLIFDILLISLKDSDSKLTCDVTSIFLYMINHYNANIRNMALNVKAIHYLVKAHSRLLVNNELYCLDFKHKGILNIYSCVTRGKKEYVNIFKSESNDRIPVTMDTADLSPRVYSVEQYWDVVSTFYISVLSQSLEAVHLYIDDVNCWKKLYKLVTLHNGHTFEPFVAWLLYITSYQEDLFTIFPRDDHANDVIKKLYSSQSPTIKAISGIIISSLLIGNWFDPEDVPRAVSSIQRLFQLVADKRLHFSYVFSGESLLRIKNMLNDPNLYIDVKLFLLFSLRKHLSPALKELNAIALNWDIPIELIVSSGDSSLSISRLEKLLLKFLDDVDLDLYFVNMNEITMDNVQYVDSEIYPKFIDNFKAIFRTLYIQKFKNISDTLSQILNSMTYELSGCKSTESEVNEFSGIRNDISMHYEICLSLLILPYTDSETSSDHLFTINLDPLLINKNSSLIYSNEIFLDGIKSKIFVDDPTTDTSEQISFPNRNGYTLDLSITFLTSRIEFNKAYLGVLKNRLADYEEMHMLYNEHILRCLKVVRRLMDAKPPSNINIQTTKAVKDDRLNSYDNFRGVIENFEIDGMEEVLEIKDNFSCISYDELSDYSQLMEAYDNTFSELIDYFKFVVYYYSLCRDVLKRFSKFVGRYEDAISRIHNKFDDIEHVKTEFVTDYLTFQREMETETNITKKLMDNITMSQRIQDMIKATNVKISSCKSRIGSTEERIHKVPVLINETVTKRKQMESKVEELNDEMGTIKDEILKFQSKMAEHESLKNSVSTKITSTMSLFSALDASVGKDSVEILNHLDAFVEIQESLRPEFINILSDNQYPNMVDPSVVEDLRNVVFRKSQEFQTEYDEICKEDVQMKINTLNSRLSSIDDTIYKVKHDIASLRRTEEGLKTNSLDETLSIQRLLIDNLETTNNQLQSELEKTTNSLTAIEVELGTIKANNVNLNLKMQQSRTVFLKNLKYQRMLRLESFSQILSLEFLARHITLEEAQINRILSIKPDVINKLTTLMEHENKSRMQLVASFKDAVNKFNDTTNFLSNI
ncbi:hypothetical protein BEWA_052900 [Theileria equi strain WA]|uniref:PX domain-containing protein n=1 Tax=Theileria equi strain WA TaxID=1537102 RepID=L1LDA6_THEEQ|nr:hypothetical protein BEWA_052900 [Theileria equi strain WA]EKX73235.1 hypothetical protein BEWA_052900 [Theileria equi strain WA]|eukprot:XP_004832687.1 hypothetical protein BEWA_052900 [Theileria equi strain WA]